MAQGNVSSATEAISVMARRPGLPDKVVLLLRALTVLMFVVVAVYYVLCSIHWQMTVDSPIMHYVNFLMDHGRQPYSEITDNNMPGAYYTESLAMHVFGGGDLAWRIYDFFLTGVLTGALIVIALPYDWVAGVFASGLFLTVHAAEGADFSVEREQVIVVLLAVGFAALFTATRRNVPTLMGVLGIACGVAMSIKPTFLPVPFALVGIQAFALYRRRIPWEPYAAWAVAGLGAVAALDAGFLLQHHAVGSFLFVLRTIMPAYASLDRFGMGHLWSLMVPKYGWPLVLFVVTAGLARWGRHGWWTWEQWALAMGAAFGLLSYFAQGKGFAHHRYTYLVLIALLMGIEIFAAMRQTGSPFVLGAIGLLFVALVLTPYYIRELHRRGSGKAFVAESMEADLRQLGGKDALQDKVQCFDMVEGCLNALYHLQLVENTSFTGDMLLFTKDQTVATRYYRTLYMDLARRDPPTVLIVSNMVLLQKNSFDKLKIWPQFDQYVQQNFTEVAERHFPSGDQAYRIYIRKEDPLLARAMSLKETGVY